MAPAAPRGRRAWLAATGVAVSAIAIAILLWHVDLAESWTVLRRLRADRLLFPLAAFLVNIPLRAWRWRLIYPRGARPPFSAAFSALGISNMSNLLLPARAGDLARCVLVGQRSVTGNGLALATLALEKVLDGLALVAMVLVAAWALHPPGWVLALVRLAAVGFGGALVVLLALRVRAGWALGHVDRLLRRRGHDRLAARLDDALSGFVQGLGAVAHAGQMLVLLVATTAVWASEALLVWGISAAVGVDLAPESAVVVTAVLGLGLMVPAAPGGLGTYELAGTLAFQLVGVETTRALAATAAVHAWVFASNVALGIALLALRGLGLGQLRRRISGTA